MKRNISLKISLTIFLISVSINAQITETLASHPTIRDGVHVDDNGDIYTTSGGFVGGVTLGKYDVGSETFDPSFISSVSGPIEVGEKQDGTLVVTNFDNNTVSEVDPITGVSTLIASGLDGPAGLVVDDNDAVYVTNFGSQAPFSGHQIHKISSNGDVTILVDDAVTLNMLQAITINNEGDLIIHSEQKLYKVDPVTGDLTFWVSVGKSIGNMTFREEDNCIYATSPQNHQILKIDENGTVSIFAGSVAGYQDGDLANALFRNPLGIDFSLDENTIYIAEAGYTTSSGRLRQIVLDANLSIVENETASNFMVYPNPTKGIVTFSNFKEVVSSIEVYDISGRLVAKYDSIFDNSTQIDLSDRTLGLYLVKVFSSMGLQTFKIIKK